MTTHTNDSQTACAEVREWEHSASVCAEVREWEHSASVCAEVREWEHSASVCAGCSHCVSVAPLVGLLPLLLSVVPLGLHHRTCADIPVTNSDQQHDHLDSDTTHYTHVLPTVVETLTTQSNTHSLTIHRKSTLSN